MEPGKNICVIQSNKIFFLTYSFYLFVWDIKGFGNQKKSDLCINKVFRFSLETFLLNFCFQIDGRGRRRILLWSSRAF